MNEQSRLARSYSDLLRLLGMDENGNPSGINTIIKAALRDFMESHDSVAVYCCGKHTKMLMTDFIFELKGLSFIIDNNMNGSQSGFKIIRDDEIEKNGIDGIIISTFKYLDEIKSDIRKNHPKVQMLDIYEELQKKGIEMQNEYYAHGPYISYSRINWIQSRIEDSSLGEKDELGLQLIREYVRIKDFRMAIEVANDLYDADNTNEILSGLKELYKEELEAASQIASNNILMLCMDGLRACDFSDAGMSKTHSFFDRYACMFERAYSYSNSTFESLVPAFSENSDQKTSYYTSSEVHSEQCRFMRHAIEQKREIFIYGDGFHYIVDDAIHYTDHSQSFSEKIWDFIIDSEGCKNGLFYLHELYESHFSYPNPYTKGRMIADGTAMVFDYMPKNGGELRTDYRRQHDDSIKYLDDTLFPVLKRLRCSILFFADHGNMVMEPNMRLEELRPIDLTVSEEWIRIPLAIISHDYNAFKDYNMMSLLDINDLMMSLLETRGYESRPRRFIKIGRSALYNPDFKWIYTKLGWEQYLMAFEGFVFEDDYKILVFSNGYMELYFGDNRIDDSEMITERYNEVKEYITCCSSV